ncbi:hypothetical protein BKA56DRAFT_637340 [Ilyonectria sp. MPI-CAGE-AT-0026]|nr:hypothetical protein BKA56DRAFT_637340 [Ilyonectria sp. MPI-CAGE-AT-0026]
MSIPAPISTQPPQGKVDDRVFQTFFNLNCCCSRHPKRDETEQSHTLQERVQYLQRSLPPLATVFGERGSYDPSASFPQWQSFLSDRPLEPLSFCKNQDALPESSISVERRWDIDSVWFGATSLHAIRPPNDFRLSLLPPFHRNLSTNQVIQPHGLDLANTRHILFGSFNTSSVRFEVFLFFPGTARSPRSMTTASSNALSLERQKDLYDRIIIPAAYETISDPIRQEIPRSYDLAYAKSRAYRGETSRSFHLRYTLPAQDLPLFWQSVVRKANACQVATRRGDSIVYFQNPQLLFQAHDLKNTFARPSLEETLAVFQDTVLVAVDPNQLDIHSCWIDIGTRDYVAIGPGAYTLLWKSQCHNQLDRDLSSIATEATVAANHFRSFLLRDVGTYMSKAKPMRGFNPGHPEVRQPAIIRTKAYNCNKELFSVMYSDYRLFGSGSLPLLALDEGMIKDLSSSSQDRQRASTTPLTRGALLQAWEANKRHLRAISGLKSPSNYGVRKEVTFRLDVILTIPHTGLISQMIPLTTQAVHHVPFWVVPTKDINALIFTQAARLVLPLDYLFQVASVGAADPSAKSNPTETSVHRILGFYTAQLFYRLLALSFTSEQHLHYDNWIWLSRWRVRNRRPTGRGTKLERRGLGLGTAIEASGMLWIPHAQIDWNSGCLALETLIGLYIPRSPLQARLVSQTNVQSLTASKVTVELFLYEWLRQSQRAFDRGQHCKAEELAERVVRLAAEEIARAYHQHLLLKLRSYWSRVQTRAGSTVLRSLSRLRQGLEESATQVGRIVNAQTIWEVYTEAWTAFAQVEPAAGPPQMPRELPCWMTTRKYLPPDDGWSNFVFQHLFNRPSRPKWDGLYFLQLYRSFKGSWEIIQEHAGSFDDRFRRIIGNFILVTFNNDRTKEVGTKRSSGTWYEGKPRFFRIQFWAPYFSPPERDQQSPWNRVPNYYRRHSGIQLAPRPKVITVKEFHNLASAFQQLWSQVMRQPKKLREATPDEMNEICERALHHLVSLVGPQWSCESGLPCTLPWDLANRKQREEEHEDPFRVPIPPQSIRGVYCESKLCQPTILLPTRHNVVALTNAVESFHGLRAGVLKLTQWIREGLDNDGQQYSLLSHLETKQIAAEPAVQPASLLRRFLLQTEPPQRLIREDGDTAAEGLYV